MMYKIRIINRAWLKGGDYGEHKTRDEAIAQIFEYTTKSDADRWEREGDYWRAYVEGIPIAVLTMEVIEVQS